MDYKQLVVICLAILTLTAVGVVLNEAEAVVLPLVIAWLLVYILAPAVDFLRRHRFPETLAIALVLLALLGVCGLVAAFMDSRIAEFVDKYPTYQVRFERIVKSVTHSLSLPDNWMDRVDWSGRLTAVVEGLAQSAFTFMSELLMVIIFLVFLLLGRRGFREKLRVALPFERAEKFRQIYSAVSRQIGTYLGAVFFISLATGALVWAALAAIGVQFAATWGFLAFLLNFIPTLGSVIATIPPVLLAFVQYYPNWWPAILAAILLTAIQQVIGNVVSPKVMGDRLNLSPVVILFSLLFWGWLWGVVGAILSTPIAAAIKIVCENVEPLRPVAVLMGSKAESLEPLEPC